MKDDFHGRDQPAVPLHEERRGRINHRDRELHVRFNLHCTSGLRGRAGHPFGSSFRRPPPDPDIRTLRRSADRQQRGGADERSIRLGQAGLPPSLIRKKK